MTKVLYPGSFDPITRGHMNIIEQASELFDEVVVAVMQNPAKKTGFFTIEERLEMISDLYKRMENIKVVSGTGAAVDVAILNECKAIVRGLRGVTDFDYELQLSHMNRDISNNQVNTICLFSDNRYQYLSSSAVKEIFYLDKDISDYVDVSVKGKMLLKRRCGNG